jgi:MYXO-CTERM domain-containing protein
VAGTGSPWNITMPAILIALLGYGLIRRRKQQ